MNEKIFLKLAKYNNPFKIALAITALALAIALALEWLFTRIITPTTIAITIPIAFILSYLLINSMLRYQRELDEQRHQLEAATRDLSYANGRMLALNEDLDAFAQTVAHELKTPLGVILGYSHLLSKETYQRNPQKISEAAHQITDTSLKMNSIIQEMLLFSKLRQENEIDIQSLNMDEIVSEALHRMEKLISESNAQIKKPAEWPNAHGYAPWIEEVWSNYLSNALKYGGTPPEIELGAEQQANGQIRFWVRDSGPGMTKEEQKQLFNRFTRLHTTKATGNGLGLSITQRIVKKLGGEVGVESYPQNGSTFYFTLPEAH